MSKEKKKSMTPKVRFPEFREAGEWVQVSFLAVRDKKTKWSFTGGPFGSNLKASDYVANGIRVIQLQNIGDGEFIDEYKIFTSTEKANELLSCNIYPGEIILSKMGDPVGRACIVPNTHERYVMCSDGIRLVVDEEKHDKYFIYSLINAKQFRALIEKTATGSTRKRIGLDELKQLPFFVPSKIKEQQKIASTLTSLDDLITVQSEKIKALQAHRKGLMQQLFPAEGERTPRVRFGEFEGSGDWEERTLDQTFEFQDGFAFSSSHFSDSKEHGMQVIRITDINNKNKNNDKVYVPISLVEELNLHKYVIKKGDLLLSLTGAAGFNFFIWNFEDALINQRTMKIFSKEKENLSLKILLEPLVHEKINAFGSGQNNNLSKEALKQVETVIPKPKEQQKIAATLTSLDNLITTQHEKLEALKMQKKGLMQQLFPNPNDEAI